MQTIDYITEYLKNNLSEKRFIHTMGVAEVAQSLAMKWGEDSSLAFLAGLVHDCAKEIKYCDAVSILEDFGYEFDGSEREFPMLIHGPCGAAFAKKKFGIENENVLNAVRYHTVGQPTMSLLEKIVYIADFIEPDRSFKEAELVRRLAFEDLDKAVLAEADTVIKFNIDRGAGIHPDTIITRNYYLKLTKEGTENEA